LKTFLNLSWIEIILIFWAALGLLYLISAFPLEPVTFQYQEL
tara:strand:- start:35 stop:160 length:126 start_codon:yes stop_codon:yes gene_type:complete